MKSSKLIFVLFCLLSAQPIFSQSWLNDAIIIHLSQPGKPGYLNATNAEGSIKVTGYNGSDVLINGSIKNKNKLREYVDVNKDDKGNGVVVSVNSDDYPVNIDIKVPYSFSLTLNSEEGEIDVKNISGQMTINNIEGNISLSGVSGSGIISSIEGNINSVFTGWNSTYPIHINSIDGNIDLTLPATTKANVNVKTESGNIYTDFNLNFNTQDAEVSKSRNTGMTKISFDDWLYGKINGGGQKIAVKSVDGNIYIRKGK